MRWKVACNGAVVFAFLCLAAVIVGIGRARARVAIAIVIALAFRSMRLLVFLTSMLLCSVFVSFVILSIHLSNLWWLCSFRWGCSIGHAYRAKMLDVNNQGCVVLDKLSCITSEHFTGSKMYSKWDRPRFIAPNFVLNSSSLTDVLTSTLTFCNVVGSNLSSVVGHAWEFRTHCLSN